MVVTPWHNITMKASIHGTPFIDITTVQSETTMHKSKTQTTSKLHSAHHRSTRANLFFSRKRPRRVPSKKALPLKTVIKDCHQTSPKVKTLIKDCHQTSPKVKTLIKDCHQTSPKVLLKWWLSLKIVIKHRPKFCWSDGCLSRLSSKAAQSSAEVMAVFKDCHQTSPKVLLKWWLSSKTREKTANLQRLQKRTREKTAEKYC